MTSDFLVLGYFSQKNFGDDLFQHLWETEFGHLGNFTFVNPADVDSLPTCRRWKAIIFGGGDVINRYFMAQFESLLSKAPKWIKDLPRYAISVGVPYLDDLRYVDMFDKVVLRSKVDLATIKQRLGDENVTYMPDMSHLITPMHNTISHPPKKIGLFMSRPFIASGRNRRYDQIMQSWGIVINGLFEKFDCQIHAVPFNTNKDNHHECDVISNREVRELIRPEFRHRFVEECEMNVDEMIQLFSTLDFAITSRYHATLMASWCNVPFVAVYSTRKIGTFLEDEGLLDRAYPLPLDPMTFAPTNLDPWFLLDKIESLLATPMPFLYKSKRDFKKLITNLLEKCEKRKTGAFYFSESNTIKLVKECLEIVDAFTNPDAERLARALLLKITGSFESDYLWGFIENLKNPEFNVKDGIKWVIEDFYLNRYRDTTFDVDQVKRNIPETKSVLPRISLDVNWIRQTDCKGLHRSGWSWVTESVHIFQEEGALLFDSFMDRTWLWGYEALKDAQLVPFKRDWIGVIHHTFAPDISPNNDVARIFANPDFIESLKYCKCIIVLSEYLNKQVRNALDAIGCDIKTQVMYHPTEFVSKKWSVGKFVRSNSKKVVQIGAWCRNTYSIFELPLNARKNPLRIKKAALKGKRMENYYPPPNFIKKMRECVNCALDDGDCGKDGCRHGSRSNCRQNVDNVWVKGMFNMLEAQENSVEMIEHVSDVEYDRLLSKNIVFSDITDASANNLVCETAVRSTPAFYRRHPALEDYLGHDYPGFWEDLTEASEMIRDSHSILETHRYLANMDKDKFRLSVFLEQLQRLVETL